MMFPGLSETNMGSLSMELSGNAQIIVNGSNGGLQHSTSCCTDSISDYPPGLEAPSRWILHDLICVGFGPASLAVAIALNDMESSLAKKNPRVRFLERQAKFHWHAGMLLPGAKMQISFIKDLATLRDPRSRFTFLNYLKQHNRLVDFSNLGTFLPSRLEFEDYMAWAAGHFRKLVNYGQEVHAVRPVKRSGGGLYDMFEVCSRDVGTGELTNSFTKNVVIAIGGTANRPSVFPERNGRVLHSSEYSVKIGEVLPSKEKNYCIAIVGSGQSAAEVYHDLHSRYPNASTRLIIRDTALRPSDDSPFVNEVFNPEAVDTFYTQSAETRSHRIEKDKASNYSVVRLELLERIYEDQYMQGVRQTERKEWQHQILTSKEIVDVVDLPQDRMLKLVLKSLDTSSQTGTETFAVDAVILATGYRHEAHHDMLNDCQVINASKDGKWKPQRDYSLKLDRSQVSNDMAIWLQGCNESTHGLADSLLSILATRSGELVSSMFGQGSMLNGC